MSVVVRTLHTTVSQSESSALPIPILDRSSTRLTVIPERPIPLDTLDDTAHHPSRLADGGGCPGVVTHQPRHAADERLGRLRVLLGRLGGRGGRERVIRRRELRGLRDLVWRRREFGGFGLGFGGGRGRGRRRLGGRSRECPEEGGTGKGTGVSERTESSESCSARHGDGGGECDQCGVCGYELPDAAVESESDTRSLTSRLK